RSDLDFFIAGRGQLVRVGAVFDGAEPAQVDRGRAAAGKSARVEVVGSGNGQRDIAVGTLELERDAGLGESLIGGQVVRQTGARKPEKQGGRQGECCWFHVSHLLLVVGRAG